MLLNKNKILMLAVMGAIANIPSGADAQTFYQCKPKACNDGEYFNGTGCVKLPVTCSKDEILSGGKCYSTNTSGNWTLLYDYQGGVQGSGTLSAGTYIVSLTGGNGGHGPNSNKHYGGHVNYQFTLDKASSFKYAVGINGWITNSETQNYSFGGGGGTWIAINDQYIVAGGGGGAGKQSQNSGAGGAVGGGSSARISAKNCHYPYYSNYTTDSYSGASSGPKDGAYAGGNIDSTLNRCSIYVQFDDDESYFEVCYPGKGINDANGGQCAPTNIYASFATNLEYPFIPATGGTADGILLYPGAGNTKVGGDAGQPGSATHATNTTAVSGCSATGIGCLKLYKFKY